MSEQVTWVKLKKYCELTGETPMAVYKRRATGGWQDGRQCKIGPNGALWINLKEAQAWVAQKVEPPRVLWRPVGLSQAGIACSVS